MPSTKQAAYNKPKQNGEKKEDKNKRKPKPASKMFLKWMDRLDENFFVLVTYAVCGSAVAPKAPDILTMIHYVELLAIVAAQTKTHIHFPCLINAN